MSISLNGDGIISGVSTLTTPLTGITTFSSVVIGSGSTSAPAISPNGDSNTGVFFPSADTIAFAEGGVEALRITSTSQLQATGASDVRLTLGSSGTAGTNDSNHIRGDGTSLKFMNASGGVTVFENNGTERFRITNDGVTFNGDTAAVNALDDYEEGTFTFTVVPGGGSYQYNYGNTGYYTKIGELVYINAWVHVTVSSPVSGSITFNGLPFAVDGTGTRPWIICGGYNHASAPSTSSLFLVLTEGSTTGAFTYNSSTLAGTTAVTAGNLPTGAEIYIDGCYRVA